MTRDEHKAAIQNLFGMIAADHQAAASEILNNLSNDYESTLTSYETANANVTKLTTDNEALRVANGKLFIQLGTPAKQDNQKQEDKPGQQQEQKLTFDALFNEKGDLI